MLLGLAGAGVTIAAAAAQDTSPRPDARPQLTWTYDADTFGDLAGGLDTGWTYQGRLGLILDADLDRAMGWRGASAHLSLHQIHGQGVTQGHVGALMGATGLEAEPATRLFNLWIEQGLGDKASVRVGQFTAGQEFFISANASTFVNSTFGWPAILAADLPSGGPAYPLATPGVLLSLRPDARTTLLVAIFNGDPAGPGDGDPQRRDRSGLNSLRLSGKPFLIAEAQHDFGPASAGDPDARLRLGGWAYLDRVDDQRRDRDGRPLGDPASSGLPARLRGDQGLYAILDSVVRRDPGGEVALFIRAAVAPADRNLIDLYADAGLTRKGPLPGRPDDVAGLAVGYSRISAAARGRDADANRLSGAALPVRDHEIVLEATYQARITAHWSLQPDLQYIIHPGGGAAADGADTRIANAVVVGLRSVVRF